MVAGIALEDAHIARICTPHLYRALTRTLFDRLRNVAIRLALAYAWHNTSHISTTFKTVGSLVWTGTFTRARRLLARDSLAAILHQHCRAAVLAARPGHAAPALEHPAVHALQRAPGMLATSQSSCSATGLRD
jgi:hypothetical protein